MCTAAPPDEWVGIIVYSSSQTSWDEVNGCTDDRQIHTFNAEYYVLKLKITNIKFYLVIVFVEYKDNIQVYRQTSCEICTAKSRVLLL